MYTIDIVKLHLNDTISTFYPHICQQILKYFDQIYIYLAFDTRVNHNIWIQHNVKPLI